MGLMCASVILVTFLCTLITITLCTDTLKKYELCSPTETQQCKTDGTCLTFAFDHSKILCLGVGNNNMEIGRKSNTHQSEDVIYECKDVGYKWLRCKNNGTCIVVDYGTKNQSALCVCARGYYGQQCEYNGKIVQKFTMPTTAWTIQGDSNYIYITPQHECDLISYKLNSSGLIIGSDYKNSINKTLHIANFENQCDLMASAMSADKETLFVTEFFSHTIFKIQTNPLVVDDDNITLNYSFFGVAIDSYYYLWVTQYNPTGDPKVDVFDRDGNFVTTIILDYEVHQPSFSSNGGILIKPNDQLFIGDWGTLLIYQIYRDENNVPINLTMISKVTSFHQSGLLVGFNYDKWGNVLMNHVPQIEIYMSNNQLSKIIPPENNVFWRSTWTDPDTGYAFVVGDSSSLYVIDYTDMII